MGKKKGGGVERKGGRKEERKGTPREVYNVCVKHCELVGKLKKILKILNFQT